MSVIAAFSVTPIGVSTHVSAVVAEAVRVVRESGIPHRTDAMFTTLEGDDLDQVMTVVKNAIEAVALLSPRVSSVIKIDYLPGRTGGLTNKVTAIDDHLKQADTST